MIGRLASVGGFTALSRVAGFFRDVLMAAVLGAGPVSDAFMVAFRLPNNFRAIFAEGAFSAAFLPRYAAAAAKDGKGPASPAAKFANEVFAWQFVAQLILLVLALVFMREIISVLAPGFSDNPDQQALAVELSRITFPYLFCIAIVTQLSSMLNAANKFRAAAAAPIFLNLSMIAFLSLAQFFPSPAHAVSYGVLVAGVLELAFIVWAAARTGLALRFGVPRWNAEMRDFMSAPTLSNPERQVGGARIERRHAHGGVHLVAVLRANQDYIPGVGRTVVIEPAVDGLREVERCGRVVGQGNLVANGKRCLILDDGWLEPLEEDAIPGHPWVPDDGAVGRQAGGRHLDLERELGMTDRVGPKPDSFHRGLPSSTVTWEGRQPHKAEPGTMSGDPEVLNRRPGDQEVVCSLSQQRLRQAHRVGCRWFP
jgi:hypothetical protein